MALSDTISFDLHLKPAPREPRTVLTGHCTDLAHELTQPAHLSDHPSLEIPHDFFQHYYSFLKHPVLLEVTGNDLRIQIINSNVEPDDEDNSRPSTQDVLRLLHDPRIQNHLYRVLGQVKTIALLEAANHLGEKIGMDPIKPALNLKSLPLRREPPSAPAQILHFRKT